MRKWHLVLSVCMALLLVFSPAVSAFSDLPEGDARGKLEALQKRGIVNGYGDIFRGEQQLTNAEGVHLIVKTTGLSLAAFTFIKAPLASDFFDSIADDAWYAESFIIAAVNGLELPKDIDPEAAMNREEYAHYLLAGLSLTGDYAFTEMFFSIEDEQEVNPDYMNSLQVLLNGRIITLPEDGKFRPKEAITRQEAAVWAFNVLQLIESHQNPEPETEFPSKEVTLSIEAVSPEVNKITLSRGEQPHSGYGIAITRIVFQDETAQVHYKLLEPEEGKMYLQVITVPVASTYVSSEYKVVSVQDQ